MITMNGGSTTDTHIIRIARPSDSDAASDCLLASFSSLLSGSYDRDLLEIALPTMTKANPALLASGTYYVAESGTGALVGCGGWTRERPGTGETVEGEGYVRHLATHPQALGRGIGRALLARCFADARPHIRTLHCIATLNAEPFYRACGFRTIGPMDVPLGPDVNFPAILMRRELD